MSMEATRKAAEDSLRWQWKNNRAASVTVPVNCKTSSLVIFFPLFRFNQLLLYPIQRGLQALFTQLSPCIFLDEVQNLGRHAFDIGIC